MMEKELRYNKVLQQPTFLAHEFAFANCPPTLRDKVAAENGVIFQILGDNYIMIKKYKKIMTKLDITDCEKYK